MGLVFAVRDLSKAKESLLVRYSLKVFAFPFDQNLLRLNDWVSNVCDAAYEAIRSRLKAEYGRSFIANLALVSRLEEAGRADHKAFIQAINELLQSAECRTALLESLKSAGRFIRRSSFRLAFNSTKSERFVILMKPLPA